MKHILLSFCLLFAASALTAQKIDFKLPINYSKVNPSKVPTAAQSAFWYNSATGVLWKYDKTAAAWVEYLAKQYAEAGISNDTLSISFAGTTADTLQGLTAGNLNGFSLSGDGGYLVYNGVHTKTFAVSYSTSCTFAEASVVFAYIAKNGTADLLTRTRALPATAGNTINLSGNGIISLATGDTVSLFFVPATHSGTDALTVYEANITLTEL